jgi:hypothetical protein
LDLNQNPPGFSHRSRGFPQIFALIDKFRALLRHLREKLSERGFMGYTDFWDLMRQPLMRQPICTSAYLHICTLFLCTYISTYPSGWVFLKNNLQLTFIQCVRNENIFEFVVTFLELTTLMEEATQKTTENSGV